MNPRYTDVASRAGHRCEYCHAPEPAFNLPFEVEHIVPLSRGGGETSENLALACRSCNVHKGAEVSATDQVTGDTVTLFNPRTDAWDAHFRADETSGAIVALSAAGRATVSVLGMNKTRQMAARRLWARLGLYP